MLCSKKIDASPEQSGPTDEAEKVKSEVEKSDAEKSNEKLKNHLIFQPPETASEASLPKFYKKRGRQRTEAKTKSVIMYRLTRKKWPYGLSEYMQWYYDTNYIQRGSKNYGKTQQWRQEIKQASTANQSA